MSGTANTEKPNFLPTTIVEARARGWDSVDVVLVTGDAYVDHPSFAMAILGRVLEKNGFKVAILSQPDWRSAKPWKEFGRPNLFFAISAGNMDSMINHYTANRKVRNDDAYSPGGRIGLRPDRATLVYTQRAKEAYPGAFVVAGGVEASLRRLAHYDYWSDTVKPSILLDSKADLVAYGMGEKLIVEIAKAIEKGESTDVFRKFRGVAYCLGKKEANEPIFDHIGQGMVEMPCYDRVKTSRDAFCEATRLAHIHINPFAKTLIQRHGARAVIITPAQLPLEQHELDAIYDLPFTRKPHPRYNSHREKIPAYEMIKDSVTIMRGCFGGCTFCSITAHQGRIVQSRSHESIVREIRAMANDSDFCGYVSDIGGPTANMYAMRCTRPDIEKKCQRLSCVHPTICKLLGTDHSPLIKLMKLARSQRGINKVFVASGVRMDLALRSSRYIAELARHHVSGYLKVAPEHCSEKVLRLMKKPLIDEFKRFAERFKDESKKVGKNEQFIVPYFMSAHPGCDMSAMIELAMFLKRHGFRPQQVQDFIPAPFDIATCMYHTGINPMTGEKVFVARRLRDRKSQRALLQFFMPQNYQTVREVLTWLGRGELIGRDPQALVPDFLVRRECGANLRRSPNI